jgi:hypothetical protein
LAKWREVTGLNLQLIKNINNEYEYVPTFNNNLSVIGFDNTIGLMEVKGSYARDNTSSKIYRTKGSHIRINYVPASSYTWNYSTTQSASTTQVSFYNTILHELGHILLLAHVNIPYKLMHYGEYIDFVNPIINLPNETSAVNAVNKVITDSKTINWGSPLLTLADSIPKPIIGTASSEAAVICNENPANLTVTNSYPSNPPVNYLWSNGATTKNNTISSAGTYTVTVTRNGCAKVSDPFVVENSTLSATFNITNSSVTKPPCNQTINNDGSIVTTVTGTHEPYSYLWQHQTHGQLIQTYYTKDIYNLEPGEYHLQLSNSKGCSVSYTQNLGINGGIAIAMRFLVLTDSYHATAMVLGGIPPYTYEWVRIYSVNGVWYSKSVISTSNTADVPCMLNHSFLEYTLTVIDSCGNQAIKTIPCVMAYGNKQIGNLEEFTQQNISIYPNPSSEKFQISGIQFADIQIFNSLGDLVYTQNNVSENTEINSENLTNGIYFIKVFENNIIQTLKLIIDK